MKQFYSLKQLYTNLNKNLKNKINTLLSSNYNKLLLYKLYRQNVSADLAYNQIGTTVYIPLFKYLNNSSGSGGNPINSQINFEQFYTETNNLNDLLSNEIVNYIYDLDDISWITVTYYDYETLGGTTIEFFKSTMYENIDTLNSFLRNNKGFIILQTSLQSSELQLDQNDLTGQLPNISVVNKLGIVYKNKNDFIHFGIIQIII